MTKTEITTDEYMTFWDIYDRMPKDKDVSGTMMYDSREIKGWVAEIDQFVLNLYPYQIAYFSYSGELPPKGWSEYVSEQYAKILNDWRKKRDV